MTHSYRISFFHLVWATKGRRPLITDDVQERLYTYMGGIINARKGQLLQIGGIPDHVHLLIELSVIDNFSHLIREVKAGSSLWLHRNFPKLRDFSWQDGYGGFTVSFSAVDSIRNYILNQEEHHKKMSFEEEYLKLLKLHGIAYDERYVLG